jgi:serine/threonine protein kinase
MQEIDLARYQITGLLGTGADYEVRSAKDLQSETQVVLKRPVPQTIIRQMHTSTESRSDQTIKFYQEIGHSIPQLSPLLGYSSRDNHDEYYGDTTGYEYRVLVMERAKGIPLVGDVRSRILKVPIGLGQNLFALYPLPYYVSSDAFTIQEQLLNMQTTCYDHGYILLDINPQNVFYDPSNRSIKVIDSGDLIDTRQDISTSNNKGQRDINYFYLELMKYYTTTANPPDSIDGYRNSYGMRPIISLSEEIRELSNYNQTSTPDISLTYNHILDKIETRQYGTVTEFKNDLTEYLDEVRIRDRDKNDLPLLMSAWYNAIHLLTHDHWSKYIFDPAYDLIDVLSQE